MITITIKNNKKIVTNELSKSEFIESTKLNHFGYFGALKEGLQESDFDTSIQVYKHLCENDEFYAFDGVDEARNYFLKSDNELYISACDLISEKHLIPSLFKRLNKHKLELLLNKLECGGSEATMSKTAFKLLSKFSCGYEHDEVLLKLFIEALNRFS